MTRIVSLIAVAALAATPALAQTTEGAATAATVTPAVETAPAPVPAPEAAPAPAPEAAAETAVDPNVYQVLRAGDRNLTCDQIIAETNTLNAGILAAQKKAQKGKAGGKFVKGVAGGTTAGAMKTAGRFGLSRMAGSLGPMGALVAMAATDAVADSTGQAIANSGDAPAEPQVAPEQQRMNHLLGIYREKGC